MAISNEEYQKALEEFLLNGGEVQQIPIGKSSPTVGQSMWGKPRKAAETVEDVIDSLPDTDL